MRFRFRAPLAANPRMENLFERALFSRVVKHYSGEVFSIQLLIDRKNRSAQIRVESLFNLRIKIDKSVCGTDPRRKIWHWGRSRADTRKTVLLPVEIPPVIPMTAI